jgi:hypothetical protein
MYQPTLARFLSRDPLSQNGVDVLTDTGLYSDRLAAMSGDPWYYGGNWGNPYVYARNNPVRYTDPSGLEVTIRCGPVTRYGVTWGYHCAVVVECNGKTCRYEGGGEQTVGRDPGYPDRPVPTRRCTSKPMPMLPGEHEYKVCNPWRACENEMKCLDNAFNRILQLPYRRLGPNSNTYAKNLLCACSLSFKPFLWPAGRDPRIGVELPPTRISEPPGAVGWGTSGYGCSVAGGPPPDWK